MSWIRQNVFARNCSTAFGIIIADAGADQAVDHVIDITTLDGTGSSTTVGGGITSYLWEIISGTGLIIDSPTSSTTTISGSDIVGDHMIRLTVSDGNGNVDWDELIITINETIPLTITSSTPNGSGDGTIDITAGENGEVISLKYTMLSGNAPDSMTATYSGGDALNGLFNYTKTTAYGEVTLDGSGEIEISYDCEGSAFQVDVEIISRDSGIPIPPGSSTYIVIP